MFKRPPCPGDMDDYVWVESKYRPHWRRKRGRVKKAVLNTGFEKSSDATAIVSPASKRVRQALAPFLRNIATGPLHIRICNAFRRSLKEKGKLMLPYLDGLEMQRDYPLGGMLVCDYRVTFTRNNVRIEIPIYNGSVRASNSLVTHYYFEAVLLYGDTGTEKGLQTDATISPLYLIHGTAEEKCALELPLPEGDDFCVLLKISLLEGNQLAAHTKHYRMKVVGGRGM